MILEPGYLVCDLLGTISAEQQKRGLGVLLITHDRILADHWCDGLVELKRTEDRPGDV